MALVEKNENLKGKTVKMTDGLVISWDDAEETEEDAAISLEDEKLAEKKTLKTKNDDLKTRKVII